MLGFLKSILDTILPRKERVIRLDSYSLADLAIDPSQHTAHGIEITTLMSYRTRAVEDLIRALKYDRAGSAATLLSAALAEYLREEVASMRMFSVKPIILVPVPLHASRIAERGFNQVERVLEELPIEFRDGTISRVVMKALVRTRATPQQTRLARAERLRNVADAFAIANKSAIRDSHIILIDDVTTTGATLAATTKELQKSGTHVTVIALAHA